MTAAQNKAGRADESTPEAGPAPADQETKDLSAGSTVENKRADDGVQVEFIHHHQTIDPESGKPTDYLPGKTAVLPAGEAHSLVANRFAKYTDDKK